MTPDIRLIGEVFDGRYRVDRVLGQGGMGVVYAATQISMGRRVALKVVRPSRASEPRHVARFRREARAAGRLKHPNTIRLFDFGETADGTLYMVSEYLLGETLAVHLDNHPRLRPTEVIDIAIGVLGSLDEAHRVGLVHRDLKPDNIFLLASARGAAAVKVLDFGLVKLVDGTDKLGQLTRTGVVGGTPMYMSPENAQGADVDGRSDLYSLGVLMYEMLEGRPPFEANTAVALLLKHINEPPPPFRAGAVPDVLGDVVFRCLEKAPPRRFASAEALVEVLKRVAPLVPSSPSVDIVSGRREADLSAIPLHIKSTVDAPALTNDGTHEYADTVPENRVWSGETGSPAGAATLSTEAVAPPLEPRSSQQSSTLEVPSEPPSPAADAVPNVTDEVVEVLRRRSPAFWILPLLGAIVVLALIVWSLMS